MVVGTETKITYKISPMFTNTVHPYIRSHAYDRCVGGHGEMRHRRGGKRGERCFSITSCSVNGDFSGEFAPTPNIKAYSKSVTFSEVLPLSAISGRLKMVKIIRTDSRE